MNRFAVNMLVLDRGKFFALVAGLAFASFLSTFAACYFSGFLTRSFALVAEQPGDIWVMDRTTSSPDQYANMTASARDRVRSVPGVADATVLTLGSGEARMPDGRLQPFDVIGLDDTTLAGAPMVDGSPGAPLLREQDAAIADAGGSEGKLDTQDRPHPGMSIPSGPVHELRAGDELSMLDHRVVVAGVSHSLPRFPPRPLLFMSGSNAARVLPVDRLRTSFVIAKAEPGITTSELAKAITLRTGYAAYGRDEFKELTVRWLLATSEDVGDMATMLTVAVFIGFGFTAVMLYIFTAQHLRQYAVLTALGARTATLAGMVLSQAAIAGLLGTGIGVGLCALAAPVAIAEDLPYRMVWWAPLGCLALNAGACGLAALISLRPTLRLQPAQVFTT